jgi:16S rRNA (uracil1498-N3)-methyltransferase
MTCRRWIADEVSANRAALTGKHADHLARILRARVGQEFDIIANGVVHRARIVSIADTRVEFELGQEIPALTVPVQLSLLLAIFKFDRMEWAIEKCTELGIARIIPLIARRTDSHLASASLKRVERWRRIGQQASEQSRRATPAEISDPIKLRAALAIAARWKLLLSEAEDQSHLREIRPAPNDDVLLAIGPEGGWTEDELELFRANGWISLTLGPTILRAETAAVAATAITMSSLR